MKRITNINTIKLILGISLVLSLIITVNLNSNVGSLEYSDGIPCD